MPFICTDAGVANPCNDAQTGSSKVKIEGNGVTRVMADTAVGLIIGPGSQSVFVEGSEVSLPGDVITAHPPCGSPGGSPHCAATTTAGQGRVNASTGFAADSGDPADAPSPDLIVTSFTADETILHCSGTGMFPPTNMTAAMNNCYTGTGTAPPPPPPPPTVTYSYTVKNAGGDTAQPFVVGFWRFLDGVNAPTTAVLTMESLNYYAGVELVSQQSVGALGPGQTYSGTVKYPDLYYANKKQYAFSLYADIYNTTTEPNENNSFTTIKIPVDDSC